MKGLMNTKEITHSLGFPRMGADRQLKKALEDYWAGKIEWIALEAVARKIRLDNWRLQKEAGIDLIPSNDFSLYDHVLDTSVMIDALPCRFRNAPMSTVDRYFALARGTESAAACAMTKWFDTNYHYIVPELARDASFSLASLKPVLEFREAREAGILTMPVIVGPVTYLSISACVGAPFERMELLDKLLPVYAAILKRLSDEGAEYVQMDEPVFATDMTPQQNAAMIRAYSYLSQVSQKLKLIVANYFGGVGRNLPLFASLPVHALHIDAVRAPEEVLRIARALPGKTALSIGIVDGRNIWKCDAKVAWAMIGEVSGIIGENRVIVAASCSFLHVPQTLEGETRLPSDLRLRLAFAKEKLEELTSLASGVGGACASQPLPPKPDEIVAEKLSKITERDLARALPREKRLPLQRKKLSLPVLPTTTIGSFPQTPDVRAARSKWKKGEITSAQYDSFIRGKIAQCIEFQESVGLDVLVHGEFERNDMVEYFSQQLNGIAFTENGWVQSYGSRCVKPPIIHSDVSRKGPMTVELAKYAQSLTKRPVKGMLTGPVTILKWSFVRDDQPLGRTAFQIALALREEVCDLENAGIRIIQIDEPGLREGLPLRASERAAYLQWAVDAFRLASSGVKDETQIHTHMCYARFDGIIEAVSRMDADVISIEAARSPLERLEAFSARNYGGEVGPGVWDIHSPRVPPMAEMRSKLCEASGVIGLDRLWANPDCGLKTRDWSEVKASLENLVEAAKGLRDERTPR
jgi:5-methyltetrahydropteroyltriglutamate--homocysteine methyltransferase